MRQRTTPGPAQPTLDLARRRRGFVLLEVLVALIVLTLVGLAYLELFHASHRIVLDARAWSEAVEDAEDAIEEAKLGSLALDGRVTPLPGGFRRQMTWRPWEDGLELVTVTIYLPTGGQFQLDRLANLPQGRSAAPGEEW